MTTNFGDESGVASAQGYEYQKLVAIFYLVVNEAREIVYEVDGEDFAIYNEDVNRDSIEYIQVKKVTVGSFSLAKFKNEVFPQLWNAFENAIKIHNDKAIISTLIISCQWDDSLKHFFENCSKLSKYGMTAQEFEAAIPNNNKKLYHDMRKSKNPQKFFKFLWGLHLVQSFNQELVELLIIDYLKSCNIKQPLVKLAIIKSFIAGIKQGRITRNQIEDKIQEKLEPAINGYREPIFSEQQYHSIFTNLEKTRISYGFEGPIIDEDELFRDIYRPIERTKLALTDLYETRKDISKDPYLLDELHHLSISDCQSAESEARNIAKLTNKLYYHKTRLDNRIKSIQKTADELGYCKKV